MAQTYKVIGIDIEKQRPDERMAFCNNIDSQMKQFWNGLVGQWRSYFEATKDVDDLTKMYQQIKENV